MRLHQLIPTHANDLEVGLIDPEAQLVWLFAGQSRWQAHDLWSAAKRRFPKALIVGGSTAGEMAGTRVLDEQIVVTAVAFDAPDSRVVLQRANVSDFASSAELGAFLARGLPREGLLHAVVLADGLLVNGSALTRGLQSVLGNLVAMTGGLCGDGERFKQAVVCADAPAQSGAVALVGFYGPRLQIGAGSYGGWEPFGPERLVTKAHGNVLHELDGDSALRLYKKYLGTYAGALPASALLFPLGLSSNTGEVMRTVVSIDDHAQTMTFAGDLVEGSYVRLMRPNMARFIDGAAKAALQSVQDQSGSELALLVSGLGRKMVLRQRVEDEVEAVASVLGSRAVLTGFYAYGEFSPTVRNGASELHNQTMSVTTLRETS